MSDVLLSMQKITKLFPGVKALDNVDFAIDKGEIHGLIGENGAGKSTLMKILMGIYKADKGKILYKGKTVAIQSPQDAIMLGIGMVPQELNLNPYVSVAENIFLGNEFTNQFGHIDWNKTREEAQKVMQMVGLYIDPKLIINKLSIAQRQLVQLSRVLATGAELLIFDEPTASLTTTEINALLSLLKKLKQKGKSIIYISHRLEELFAITDRMTVMRDGRVVTVSRTADATMDFLITQMAGREVTKQKRINHSVSTDYILQVQNFSRKNEFKNISFDVKKGEVFGIGGLIGAGRTELISSIFGITQRDSGTVIFDGRKVNITDPAAAIRIGMGYVPEERRAQGIFPELSVQENIVVSIFRKLFNKLRINTDKAEEISQNYVDSLDVKVPNLKTKISSLSGGNQQKVILARWLASKSKLLFLDEPTRGIDVNAKSEIYDLIRQLTAEGMSFVVVSSEQDELLLLTDRILIMHEGVAKGIVNTSEIEKKDILEIALK
jgi:ABC-type sugar transport system ATPase subunit